MSKSKQKQKKTVYSEVEISMSGEAESRKSNKIVKTTLSLATNRIEPIVAYR